MNPGLFSLLLLVVGSFDYICLHAKSVYIFLLIQWDTRMKFYLLCQDQVTIPLLSE